jgi:hypothetical protein
VNFLLPKLAALEPDSHAILLYLPLRDYLLAILRSDSHRDWLRKVTMLLAPYLGDLTALSDAERCAALWLAQANAFTDALSALPNARALNAEMFFAEPEAVLSAAATHLRVPIPGARIAATVAGPLFSTNAKNPTVAFDNRQRVARRRNLEQTIAAELDAAGQWIAERADAPEAVLTAAALR